MIDGLASCIKRIENELSRGLCLRTRTEDQQYEVFSLLITLCAMKQLGYYVSGGDLDFRRYAQSPHSDPSEGADRKTAWDPEQLARLILPQVVMANGSKQVSIFYQGYPYIPTRERPDIIFAVGEFSTEVVPAFGGCEISLRHRVSTSRSWEECQRFLPIISSLGIRQTASFRQQPVHPLIIVETTTSKSMSVLTNQLDRYQEAFRPDHFVFVHRKALSPGKLPNCLLNLQYIDMTVDGLIASVQALAPALGHIGL